jgi:hypothetical protein
LEGDVEKALARAADAERQAALRDAELAALRHETGLWRAIKDAEAAQLSLSAAQLGKQLEREMARGAALEDRAAALEREKSELAAKADAAAAALESARGAARRDGLVLQQRAEAAERALEAARGEAAAKEAAAARQLAAERAARDGEVKRRRWGAETG